jgi:predicted Rossmann fold flavoprotein
VFTASLERVEGYMVVAKKNKGSAGLVPGLESVHTPRYSNGPQYDVVIIGAGAAGLMCAIEAGKRGRRVLIVDKARELAPKIRISGGGRCNFTNLYANSENFISTNPHFCKSALARYTQWDFIALMDKHKLGWQEKTLGQLFCDDKSTAVISMLERECAEHGVDIMLDAQVQSVEAGSGYRVATNQGDYLAESLVIASGGPSIPRMGSTDYGVQIARQFGIKSIPFQPALVPFTFMQSDIDRYFKGLSGLSFEAIVSCNGQQFREAILITHRGISGPACLQLSSYWKKGERIEINLLPDLDAQSWLIEMQQLRGKGSLKGILAEQFPKRFAARLADTLLDESLAELNLGEIKQSLLLKFAACLNCWTLKPSGTEGLRKAEVSLGGVDTDELSSKSMESMNVPGLYFVGETVDVTGWLGGYNFQWAWSSGWVAGQVV